MRKVSPRHYHQYHNCFLISLSYIDFDYANLKKDYFNNDIIWFNRFKEINQKYPYLKIQERYDNWEGIQYYYIVYELSYKGIKGSPSVKLAL